MKNDYFVRKSSGRLLGGVCAGIATYFKVDKLVVRLLTLFLCYFAPVLVVSCYAVAWLLIPLEPKWNFEKRVFYRLRKDSAKVPLFKSSDSVFLGVCKGLAYKLNVSENGLRLVFLVSSLCFGLGAIVYFVFALCMPYRSDYEIKLMKRIETLRS